MNRSPDLSVLVGDLLLNLVFKQSCKLLNSVRSQHIYQIVSFSSFSGFFSAKHFHSLTPSLSSDSRPYLPLLPTCYLPQLRMAWPPQNQNKRISFNFLQNIPRFLSELKFNISNWECSSFGENSDTLPLVEMKFCEFAIGKACCFCRA